MNNINFLSAKIELEDLKTIRTLMTELEKEFGNAVMVLGNQSNGKPQLSVCVSANLTKEKKYDAGAIVRQLAKHINGGGGGQAVFATAGGTNLAGLDAALTDAKNVL